MAKPTVIRWPRNGSAQLRADARRHGIHAAARKWGVPVGAALRIAAGLPADRSAVATVLRRILKKVESA